MGLEFGASLGCRIWGSAFRVPVLGIREVCKGLQRAAHAFGLLGFAGM